MAHKQEDLIFQAYLEQIEAGQPVDKVLTGSSDQTADLRGQLEAAEWLGRARTALAPRPGFVPASRKRLLARLQATPVPQSPTWRSRWFVWNLNRPLGLAHSPVILGVLVVILVGMLFRSSVSFSRAAPTWLPGDMLYPLKTFVENASILVKLTPEQRARTHIELARQRLIETQGLVFDGRYEQIPGLAANFSDHIDGAVKEINQISGKDALSARNLAILLQSILGQQSQMVSILAQICPDSARLELQRVLMIAKNGMSAVQDVFAPGSGSVDNGIVVLPAWLEAWINPKRIRLSYL